MVANILSDGGGRENTPLTHAYELSWHQALVVVNISSKPKEWDTLNELLRDLFFYELNKLKQNILEKKQNVFCHWQEYINNDSSRAQQRQHHDAPYAIYDFSNSINSNEERSEGSEFQSIGAKKVSSGTLFIIENPARFHQTIPAGSIVLAPYFDNRWVHNIQNLAGIITDKGSQLSHSAIVAREYGVPFVVVSTEDVKDLKQGDEITLDAIQLQIF